MVTEVKSICDTGIAGYTTYSVWCLTGKKVDENSVRFLDGLQPDQRAT